MFLALCTCGALAADGDLLVSAPGKAPLALTFEVIRALTSKTVLVKDEAGNPAHYRGVPVADVLAKADAAIPELRGKLMTETLLVKAADGYAVVFALAEIDPRFSDRDVLLCFEKDGAALNDKEGPLRMIVPDDKRHARWARRVTELAIDAGAGAGTDR